ncbi:MAG: ABC transporter ATP-binding protein [Acidobacteria bacterium]|nr:ABC transporter ATP-binding protein [Acidobacteriota bacterium]
MLVVRKLTRVYQPPAGPLEVLRGVDLTLKKGDGIAVMGPSGCGKSTLLQILGALDRPTSGDVTLEGVDPFTLTEPEQARFRNRSVGFVFQDHCLLPQLTVAENVMVPLMVGEEDTMGPERARKLLDEVGLGARLNHRPAELSGGEKQRVAIARALVRNPKLLLCDEPTGNLDRSTAEQVAGVLERVRREHQTMLVVATHSVEIAARFPRHVELVDGLLEWRRG